MLNDSSSGYLQNCCYSKQLSMALLHASHPPAQTCGGEDILYIYFFLIFPGHRILDPIRPCAGLAVGSTSVRGKLLGLSCHLGSRRTTEPPPEW